MQNVCYTLRSSLWVLILLIYSRNEFKVCLQLWIHWKWTWKFFGCNVSSTSVILLRSFYAENASLHDFVFAWIQTSFCTSFNFMKALTNWMFKKVMKISREASTVSILILNYIHRFTCDDVHKLTKKSYCKNSHLNIQKVFVRQWNFLLFISSSTFST